MGNEKSKKPKNATSSGFESLNTVLNGSKEERNHSERCKRLQAIEKRSNQWEKRLQKNRERKGLVQKPKEVGVIEPKKSTHVGSYDDMVICQSLLKESIEKCEIEDLKLTIAKVNSFNFSVEHKLRLEQELKEARKLLTLLESSGNSSIEILEKQLSAIRGFLIKDSMGKDSYVVIFKLLKNLIFNSNEEKYKRINLENKVIKEKLLNKYETDIMQFFKNIGFTLSEDKRSLVFDRVIEETVVEQMKTILEKYNSS